MNSAPPADPDWTDKLEKERQEEIQVIAGACDALGREIHEVCPNSLSSLGRRSRARLRLMTRFKG
jgi:hypothetical protein